MHIGFIDIGEDPPCETCSGAGTILVEEMAVRKAATLEAFRGEPFSDAQRQHVTAKFREALAADLEPVDGTVPCPDCWKAETEGRRVFRLMLVLGLVGLLLLPLLIMLLSSL